MSATGLEVFDRTLHKTHAWLKAIMEELGTEDRHKAYLALRAVLHALRDRLTVEEVAQLAAQLPMLVRGLYYEGWDPTGKPLKERHKEAFLAHVAEELKNPFRPRRGPGGRHPGRLQGPFPGDLPRGAGGRSRPPAQGAAGPLAPRLSAHPLSPPRARA